MSPGTDLSSLWRSAADCWCTYRGNAWYTSGGAECPAPDTSHLFSVLPFPPLPILWNVTFLTVIFSRSLQYEYFKQELFFRQLTGFYFLYPETEGTPLGSVIKHTFTTPRIRSFCTFYARTTIINCLLRHYSPTTTAVWFSKRKRPDFAGSM